MVAPYADADALKQALLGDGRDGSPAHFLAGRGPVSHLVGPRSLIDALASGSGGGYTWSESLEGVPDSARALYVDDDTDEAGLLRRAAQRWPELPAWGLRHHVVPMLAGDGDPSSQVPADFRAETLRRHAIVCPPRSGSTWLAQMLGQVGAGRAREHLRGEVLAAACSPGVDRTELWRQMAARGARNGIFATKLVGEFLLVAAGERPAAEALAVYAPPGVPIIALHRPVIDTVVSRYVASGTRLYHVRGTMSEEDRARLEKRKYRPAGLRRVLELTLAENRRVDEALEALAPGRVMHVRYVELEAAPLPMLRRICEFLGVAPRLDGLKPERLPIKLSAAVGTHARLRAQFEAELRAEGRDVEALQA